MNGSTGCRREPQPVRGEAAGRDPLLHSADVTDGERLPLEPTSEQMRASANAALELLVSFVEGLPDAPAAAAEGLEAVLRTLRDPAPEAGEPFDEVLARVG